MTKKTLLKKRFLFLPLVLIFIWILWSATKPPNWWQFSLPEMITQQPLIRRSLVILATNYGTVLGLNKNSGKVEWTFKRDKEVITQPINVENRLIVGYNDGVLVALNPDSGQQLWQYSLPDAKLISTAIISTETKIIFGDSAGTVHAISLQSGKESWTTTTPNPDSVDQLLATYGISWFGSLIEDRGKLYVIRTHGYIAEIDAQNGKVRWEKSLGSKVIADPVINRTTLFITTENQELVVISRQSGEISKSEKRANDAPLFCQVIYSPQGTLSELNEKLSQSMPPLLVKNEEEQNQQIIQVTKDGAIRSFDSKNLDEKWKLQLDSEPRNCFFDADSSLYISSTKGVLSKVSLSQQRFTWQSQREAKVLAIQSIVKPMFIEVNDSRKYYYTNYLFVSDDQEKISRLNTDTGENEWSFTTDGTSTISPVLNGSQLFVTSTNGGLYRLHLSDGKPDVASSKPDGITWKSDTPFVQANQIYELKVSSPSQKYLNPYTSVDLSVQFKDPQGNILKVDGFYYDHNEWRVRFNPPSAGHWTWEATWKDAFQKKEFSGEFLSDRSFAFLHVPSEGSRWLTRDGQSIQPLVGLNDCFVDRNQNGSPLDDFFIEDGSRKEATISGEVPQHFSFNSKVITLNTYLDTYKGGFNLFRQGTDNCSPPLYNAEKFLYSQFFVPEGKVYDEISQQLYEKKYAVWFTFFGFSLPFGSDISYPDQRYAVESYVKYIVARYGAYVDIWEISNEAVSTDEYVKTIAKYIQAYDPYRKLITVSWDKPSLKELSLIAPHWYQTENEQESDLATVGKIDQFVSFNKPIIFGEQGNQTKNWDKTSAQRMRVRIWTAFFNQASLVFWNQSDQKDHYNPTFDNSNIYLGDEERGYAQIFLELTKGMSVDLTPTKENISRGNVRVYSLKGKSQSLRYFFNSLPSSTAQIETTNPYARTASFEWFDPRTGQSTKTVQVPANGKGSSPTFQTDTFLKITLQ